jgi:carbon starvation protein CstA
MISVLVLVTIAIFAVAYVTYGRFIARQLNLGDTYKTPAHEINDGVDYVPARASLLLGQHFSAIAAAGPIVGPISDTCGSVLLVLGGLSVISAGRALFAYPARRAAKATA